MSFGCMNHRQSAGKSQRSWVSLLIRSFALFQPRVSSLSVLDVRHVYPYPSPELGFRSSDLAVGPRGYDSRGPEWAAARAKEGIRRIAASERIAAPWAADTEMLVAVLGASH